MKTTVLLSALVPSALGATIYLAGDSTMAKNGGGSGTQGMLHHPLLRDREYILTTSQAGANMSHPIPH